MLDQGPNVTLVFIRHYTQMLHKFTGLEGAYSFLRELEEVCSLIHFPNIFVNEVRMKLISFALKDDPKR